MAQIQAENKMGTAPMLKLIISMSLPAMLSMFVQALYNIVDSLFVAKVSDSALTAVSLAFPLQTLMIAFSVGTSIGVGSLVSRKLGMKDREGANNVALTGVILSFLTWVAFAVLGALFIPSFLGLFTDAGGEVFEQACTYGRIAVIFSFGLFVEIALEKIIQSTGNMIYPMMFMLVGTITNVIFDPILIFGYFGFPAMGVKGAAIATVMGQIFSMIFAIIISLKKSDIIKFSFKGFRMKKQVIGEIYRVGVPSIIMQSIMFILVSGLNIILSKISDAAVSVLGIYYKLQSFVFMPVFGLTHGVMPIMGYNYGARKKKRFNDAFKIGVIIAVGIMVIGTLLFNIFPDSLMSMFENENSSEDLTRIGVLALKTISLSFGAAACSIIISTAFQAVGHGTKSLVISIIRQLVLILPLAYVFSTINPDYIWYSFVVAEAVAVTISIILYIHFNRKYIKPMEVSPAEKN